MLIESQVSFEKVQEVFLQQNPDPAFGSTGYALGLLRAADAQFRIWFNVILSPQDILGVMLPHHDHKSNQLIPPSGLTVFDAVRKVESLPPSDVCRRRIEDLSQAPLSAVFLSATPVDRPAYRDYRDLVDRGYKGLTHLDGLHRLIAWALSGEPEAVAYVAGTVAV